MKRCIQKIVPIIVICCLMVVFAQTAFAADMVVASDGVNFRTEASLDAPVVNAFDTGTRAEILQHDPAGWSKVRVNGAVGYIKSDFLTVKIGSEPVTFKTTDTVNFRTSPSLDATVITSFCIGTGVGVIEHDPAGWSKVRADGKDGYIKSEFLALPLPGQQAAAASTGSGNGPTTLRTNSDVNFRSGPSLDAGVIKTLSANAIVGVVEYNPNGWSKVSSNGDVGYIRSDLLRAGGDVELLHWSEFRNILRRNEAFQVVDVRTGLTFNLKCFSIYDHADVVPITKADTDIIYNIRNGVWSWAVRPVWVIWEGRTIAASIHGMPHDVNWLPENGINGHFCLHFLGSTTSSTSQWYKTELQNAVQEAWNAR